MRTRGFLKTVHTPSLRSIRYKLFVSKDPVDTSNCDSKKSTFYVCGRPRPDFDTQKLCFFFMFFLVDGWPLLKISRAEFSSEPELGLQNQRFTFVLVECQTLLKSPHADI